MEVAINNTYDNNKSELKSPNLIPHLKKKEVKKMTRLTENQRKILILGDSAPKKYNITSIATFPFKVLSNPEPS